MPNWIFSMPWTIIREVATKLNLDPLMLAALVMTESGGNECAMRYESGFYHRYILRISYEVKIFAKNNNVTPDTEGHGRAISWGPMQIMGQTAREQGFKGWFPELCNNETGIFYGAKYYKGQLTRYGGDTQDALAAYNGGSVVRMKSGVYKNERYVDKVMKYHRTLSDL